MMTTVREIHELVCNVTGEGLDRAWSKQELCSTNGSTASGLRNTDGGCNASLQMSVFGLSSTVDRD